MLWSVDFNSRREIFTCSWCKMQYMLLAVYETCSLLVFVLVEHVNEEAMNLWMRHMVTIQPTVYICVGEDQSLANENELIMWHMHCLCLWYIYVLFASSFWFLFTQKLQILEKKINIEIHCKNFSIAESQIYRYYFNKNRLEHV